MPDPAPPPGLDLNLLIDRLADCDSPSAAIAPDDSTIANLKAQLDTLSEELAKPELADPFVDESACHRAIEIVAAIGKDPTFVTATDADRTNAADKREADLPASIGQYRILSQLGVGGMGAVYKALHTKLEKVVALKVLPADRLKDAGAVARFEREMRAVGKLHHPNIVAAHDAGEANGNHFLVMELVDGQDVGSLVRCRGSLPIAESCEIIRQAALGLQHAHEHGLVHRDIKPSNLMVTSSMRRAEARGQKSEASDQTPNTKHQTLLHHSPLTTHHSPPTIKILDMGLALLDESHREAAGELTSTGQIMGTLDYMAPEQGADTHAVDIRADVYSLGATLYKLLTGRAPFEGPQYNTAMKKLTALATVEPQPVRELRPDVPPELAAIVHRMLAKSSEQRPTPPAAVAELLRPFAVGADFPRLLHGDSHRLGETLPPSESATDPTVVGPTEVVADAIDGSATPAVAFASPPAPPRRRGKRVRTLLKAAAVLVPLALITIQMKQGTVTVRTDEQLAEDVKVVVKSGGEEVAVMDKDNNWTITVRAGEYQVETRGGNDEFTVKQDRIGVSRWGKTIVEVARKSEAVATDSPVQTASVAGNFCLQFDGQDDIVWVPSLTYEATHPLTIEAWARAGGPRTSWGHVVRSDSLSVRLETDVPRQRTYWLARANLVNSTQVEGFPPNSAPSRFDDWSRRRVHLAAVYDGASLRLYVDGRLESRIDGEGMPRDEDATSLTIGGARERPPEGRFEGLIDEVRISRVARYREDFTPIARFEPDEQTLALYHFDEGAGDVLHDASGHGHDGKIVGAAWVALHDVGASSTHGNLALSFDGQAAHVDIPSLTYDGSHPVTLEARVVPRKRLTEDKSTVVIGNIRDRTRQGGLVLRQFDAGWRATVFSDTGKPHYPTATDDSLDPVELALVYDLNETRLYVNGRLAQAVAIASAKHFPSTEAFFIGGPGGRKDSMYFDGVIDEVRISSTARYSRDYAPSARFEPDEHTVALYHFDEGQGDILRDASGHGHHGKIVGATWVPADTKGPRPAGSGPYDPAAERPIAEAVLRAGGNVTIVVPQAPLDAGQLQSYPYGTNLFRQLPLIGQEQTVRSLAELPGEPFHITRIQLRQQAAIDSPVLESLARAPFLFELNLERSAVNDSHAAVIGRMTQLRYLNVGGTGLTDEGLRELSRLQNLGYLSAWNTPGITDAGLEHIARLTNLVEIYLHENPQITDRGVASLRDLPHLGWLWLDGTGITDAALESVSGFEELDSINLSRTQINGAGLAHLRRLRRLNWLFLHETAITDEFAVLLKDVQFGSLWLSGTSVGDATLKAIAGRQQIHQLILNRTGITDAGLAHLQGTRIVHLSANNTALTGSGLADLDIVQVLDLSQTQLTDEAANSLMRYATLETLNVAKTPLSEETVRSLHEALPRCTIYSDFGTFEPPPAGSGPSGETFALRFDGDGDYVELPWKFDGQSPLTVEAVVSLDAPQGPWGCILTDAQTPGGLNLAIHESTPHWMLFGTNASAVSAVLGDDPLTYPGRVHFAGVYDDGFLRFYINGQPQRGQPQVLGGYAPSNMPVLIGANPDPVADGRPFALSDFFRGVIEELRISNVSRYSAAFTPAVRFEPDEHTLALYHFDEGAGDVLRDASGNGHDGTIVGATWAPSFAAGVDHAVAEWVLSVGGKVTVQLEGEEQRRSIAPAEALPGETWQLVGVDLSYTRVTDDDLARLRGAAALETLNLDSAELIGDAGLAHLAGLPLTFLELRNTQVTDAGLATLLQLPRLTSLSLQHTAVTDAGMPVVARLERLQLLVLSNNSIGDAGFAHLRGLSALRSLSVWDTELTDAGLADLAQLGGLEGLSLSESLVTDAGLTNLVKLQKLGHLHLDGTAISDAGLTPLIELPNLTELSLNGTGITDAGLEHVARIPTLRDVLLERTQVTEAGVRKLREALPESRVVSDFGTFEPRPVGSGPDSSVAWRPTAEQQSFLDAVALLPAEQQESAVREKLKAVNPGYDGFFEYEIANGKIVRLSLKGNTQTVREIWPIAALTGLTELLLGEAPVADISAVTRLTELRFLSCYRTGVTDIAPVSALRKLEEFDCRETLVRDLSPLAGLPLKKLRTFAVSPYNEQFRQLAATWPQLETINDIPIAEFLARRYEVEELRKRLPAFPAEKQLELVVEKLKEFNPGWDGGLTHHIVEGELARILLAPPHVVWDISPLAALPDLKELTCHGNPQLADLSPLAGTQLEQLYCQSSGISDLSPLRGIPLEVLVCADNPIKDLSPLAGMPLTDLLCDNSFVSDLAPLTGCPLEQLSFSSTRVSDLSPLTGMPLKYVECGTTRVTSLEALRGMQLTFLGCGQNGIADLFPLAGMPLEELRCGLTLVTDFSPLAGMPLAKLHVSSNDGLSDLSVLAGMPLAELDCRFSAVSDYSPLSGMPLERIAIDFHLLGAHDEEVLRSLPKVTEINSLPAAEFWPQVEQRRRETAAWKDALTAVSGEQQFTTVRQKLIELHATFAYAPSFSLEPIYADGNLVELSIVVHSGDLTDLRPLCGLTHLTKLSLTGHLPHVRDLSPLYALPLEELHVDSDVVLRSNLPGLGAMPTLQSINGRPAAE